MSTLPAPPHLTLITTTLGSEYFILIFANKEIEACRGEVAWWRSHSLWVAVHQKSMLLIQCYFASRIKRKKKLEERPKSEPGGRPGDLVRTLDQLELCVPLGAFVCASGPSMARSFSFHSGKVYGRIENPGLASTLIGSHSISATCKLCEL